MACRHPTPFGERLAARKDCPRFRRRPQLLFSLRRPRKTRGLRALFPFSNHKGYSLATLKIWGACGICTLDDRLLASAGRPGGPGRNLAPMLGEGEFHVAHDAFAEFFAYLISGAMIGD
jgi:hypothetical protein